MTKRQRVALSVAGLVAGVLLAIVTFMVVRHGGEVARVDVPVHNAVRRFGQTHPLWLSAMRAVTHLGDTATVATVDVIAFALCVWRARIQAAAFVAIVGISAWAIRLTLRDQVARPRPFDALWPADGFAFPSGHTTNATAMLAIMVIVAWPALRRRSRPARTAAVVLAIVLALVVGTSRVAGAVHWLSDVVGGLLLASTVVCAGLACLPLAATASPRRPG